MQRLQPVHVAGVAQLAYGVKTTATFNSSFDFDDFDLWFDDDFNFVLDNWLEDALDAIASDITSVDSTNLSEARSEQMSAQSSADRAARKRAGLAGSDSTSLTSNGSGGGGGAKEASYVSTPSSENSGTSTPSSSSVNSDDEEETTLDHAHSRRHGRYHGTTESDFSGISPSDDRYTGLSNSSGTSQQDGEASTVSTVSFTQEQYANPWANDLAGAQVKIRDLRDENAARYDGDEDFDMTGIDGLEWIGDADNEKIVGTAWLDVL